MKIIAFTGRKGHGKDTADQILKGLVPEEKRVVTFVVAETLKTIATKSLCISPDSGELIKRQTDVRIANGLTFREYLNSLGDAIKDIFGYDIWCKILIENIHKTIEAVNPDYITITDLRYPIEEAHLRKYCEDNGIELTIIKLINTNLKQLEDEHDSEALCDQINADFTIKAKSTEELELKIINMKENNEL